MISKKFLGLEVRAFWRIAWVKRLKRCVILAQKLFTFVFFTSAWGIYIFLFIYFLFSNHIYCVNKEALQFIAFLIFACFPLFVLIEKKNSIATRRVSLFSPPFSTYVCMRRGSMLRHVCVPVEPVF